MEQKRGTCVDYDAPTRAPCPDGVTEKDGFCEVDGVWCPSLGVKNFDDPPKEAKVDTIEGLEDVRLKIMSGMSFPSITDRFFVTGGSPGTDNQFKDIKVSSLLELTQPPTSLDEKVRTNGALIGVSFFWQCDVKDDCEPLVVIKRLDSGQGFVQKRVRKYRVGNEERREALYMNGLRILVDSSGVGRKFSLVNFITQIGSAIALIRVAGIVADNFMLYSCHYSAMRRDAYYKCKVQETADYSDLQDRINLIQETKSRESTARPSNSGAKGGARVALGLGAGGRGGLARALVSNVQHV